MEMTTKKIIEIFNDYDRISGILLCGNSECDSIFNSETVEAMNNINVILHKYQKIEQIYKEWFSDAVHTSAEAYRKIGEILKDGNVD